MHGERRSPRSPSLGADPWPRTRPTDGDRKNSDPLVDIAAEVMADESQRIGISYTGFLPNQPAAQALAG